MEEGGDRVKLVEDPLQGCSFGTAGKKRAQVEQETREAYAHCLEMISKLPKVEDYEESTEKRATFDAQQVELCKLLIAELSGV